MGFWDFDFKIVPKSIRYYKNKETGEFALEVINDSDLFPNVKAYQNKQVERCDVSFGEVIKNGRTTNNRINSNTGILDNTNRRSRRIDFW